MASLSDTQTNLLHDLASPVKSFRLHAIDRLFKEKGSPEFLAALRELSSAEEDEECRLLLADAIAALEQKQKPDGSGASAPDISNPEAFATAFRAAEPRRRLAFLTGLSLAGIKSVAPCAPTLLATEAHPVIIAAIIRIFEKTWTPEAFPLLRKHLTAEALSLRLAALEALSRLAPQQLAEDLPALVVSPDPRIRALAVRGLIALDPEEAVNHLRAVLLSGDETQRVAALPNLLYLPFETAKPLVLQFLAQESDPAMIEQAGALLETNPEVQTPYQLWELAESAGGEKAKRLKAIIQGVCQSLEASGLLGAKSEAYRAKLQSWIFRRAATRFLQECADRIDRAGGRLDPELEIAIHRALERPEAGEVFRSALSWPLSPACKACFAAILDKAKGTPPAGAAPGAEDAGSAAPGSTTPPAVAAAKPEPTRIAQPATNPGAALSASPVASAGPTPPAVSFESLSIEDQVRTVAGWRPEDLANVRQRLGELLQSEKTAPDLRCAALRAATRLSAGEFAEAALQFLKKGDPHLVPPALEYVARFASDRVLPFLGQYLQSPHPQVKATAIRIFRVHDPQQALSSLRAMLRNTDAKRRQDCLACMMQFDFPLVRDLLISFLQGPLDPGLLESGFCLFEANPDPENLYPLFTLERRLSPPGSVLAAEIRQRQTAFLIEAGLLPASAEQDLPRTFEERLKAEDKKKAAPKPAWAYRDPLDKAAEMRSEEVAALKFRIIAFFLTFGLIGVILYILMQPVGTVSEKRGGAIPVGHGGQIWISGRVTGRSPEGTGITFLGENGTLYVLDPAADGFVLPADADRVKLLLLPFRRMPGGMIRARCLEIK